MESGACLFTLEGHLGDIRALAIGNGRLYSGSCDATIKYWDVESGLCILTCSLEGSSNPVYNLGFGNGRLYSGSFDITIKCWDVETGASLFALECHSEWVRPF